MTDHDSIEILADLLTDLLVEVRELRNDLTKHADPPPPPLQGTQAAELEVNCANNL